MKKLTLILVTIISLFVAVPAVYAYPTFIGDNNIDINQDFNDNTIILGNQISSNSYINGVNVIFGNNIDITGEADYLVVAGNSIKISDYIAKDIFVAGSSISVKDFNLRSLYLAAANVNVEGDADTLEIGADNVTLKGNFNNVVVDAENVKIDGSIYGTLTINEDAKLDVATGTNIADKVVTESKKKDTKVIKTNIFKFNLLSKIFNAISLLIIGIIFIALFNKNINKVTEDESNTFSFAVKKALIGLGILILLPIASVILMLTIVGIIPGIFTLFIYILACYISTAISAIYLGKTTFKDLNTYQSFIIWLAILTAIKFIPIVSGFVGFITLLLGLGLVVEFIKPSKKEEVKVIETTTKPKTKTTKKATNKKEGK